jgi:pyrroline-5-carboxylate reductase
MIIGFIGIGKIASAVIEGLCTSGPADLQILLSPRNEINSRRLAASLPNAERLESNQEVIDRSDIIFIALRPQHAQDVLKSLIFRPSQQVVSFIPLLDHASMRDLTAPAWNLARAIPLPPVVNHICPIPVFNGTPEVVDILSRIGQPFTVSDEAQLHAIWTLTCLITPYYELLATLEEWSADHGVDRETAGSYIAGLFHALIHTARISNPIDFRVLATHAATPGGLNEQTGREIRESGAHEAYRKAAEGILARFPGK